MPILSVSNLSKKIKNKSIRKNINFVVIRSEILGLLGPNGAGKTTTFYTIAGLIKPSEGKIFFNKKNVTDMPMHNRSKLGMINHGIPIANAVKTAYPVIRTLGSAAMAFL